MKKTAKKEAVALTARQSRFVDEYLKNPNASDAYVRAGYSAKGANASAAKLLANPSIQKAIADRMELRSKRTEIDADYVLHRLVEIDQMDVLDILNDDGSVKAVSEWPKVWRTTLSGLDINKTITNFDEETVENILKKIKWPDKVKNLEMIGKHVTVQAWRDNVDLSNSDGSLTPKPTTIELVAPGNKVKN